ncbi:MAG: DUF58 domain-containing protein [Candidatus Omnitrophica bacterium]|nr:DUF58 domain-containing protein [Candidatus Omnitrophota bacterium]
MIPKEVITKLRRIQITTSRKVTDVFAGQYQSVFKGVGMEFSEVREYNPGDEIRSIDWNVTARMGHPFVKKFVEERQLTIIFLLDVSMSERFGTKDRLKSEVAAELCSALAFSAMKNNDKVGMMTFTDRVEKFIPPRKGVKHIMRVVSEALYNKPKGKGTDINMALRYLNQVLKRRAIVFIVSDFMAPDYKDLLGITNKKNDLIGAVIVDPAEAELPKAGVVRMHDAETGEIALIDTSKKKVREFYLKKVAAFSEERTKRFQAVNVDSIEIRTDKSYVEPLIRFFKMRERRLRRAG